MSSHALAPSRPAQSRSVDNAFLRDVLAGLGAPRKALPPKYFYDLTGSRLFDEITRLPEYYPTRTELGIMSANSGPIGRWVPPGSVIVEFGAGSRAKISLLLRACLDLAGYVPIDVSAAYLAEQTRQLRAEHPGLDIAPLAADFSDDIALPSLTDGRPLVGFFPGSTIGNFEPAAAEGLLRHFAALLGPGARLVVGVDLVKDEAVLEAAYDDAAGVTARFNLNLLSRINRELSGDFDLSGFRHHSFFNRDRGRIEMHLVSRREQSVRVAGETFRFGRGETIHTENSYKYGLDGFRMMAERAGWRPDATWTDPDRLFAVLALRAE